MKCYFNLRLSETNIAKQQKHISTALIKSFICIAAMFLTIFLKFLNQKLTLRISENTAYSDQKA